MKKVFKMCLIIAGFLVTANSMAMGIGVSLSNSEFPIPISISAPKILLPIKVGESLIIEPFFAYSKFSDPDYFESTETYKNFGVGLLSKTFSRDSLSGYMGIQLGQMKDTDESSISTNVVTFKTTQTALLYSVTYSPLANYEMGMELGVTMNKTTRTDTRSPGFSATAKANQSYSALVVRYYFD